MNRTYEKTVYFENDFTADLDHLKKMMKYPCLPYAKLFQALNVAAMAACVIMTVSAVINLATGYKNVLPVIWAVFCSALIFVTRIRLIPSVMARRNYAKQGKKDVAYHYIFDDDMLIMLSDDGKTDSYAYNVITGMRVDPDAFVLRVRTAGVVRVPKDSFTTGSPDDFAAFLLPRISKEKTSNSAIVVNIVLNLLIILLCLVFSAALLLVAAYNVFHNGVIFPGLAADMI